MTEPLEETPTLDPFEDDGEVVIIDGYTYWHKVLA